MYNYMEQMRVRAKKWGNSFGVILPKKVVDREKIKEGTEIVMTIIPVNRTKVKDVFGILKGKIKKETWEITKEVDRELWQK